MGKIAKKTRRPTLKQQAMKEGKIVKADSLNWKSVDIPDNLGDYEGLYGLEELEGVDVEIVNGKAEFIVKETGEASKQAEDKEESNAKDKRGKKAQKGKKDKKQKEVKENDSLESDEQQETKEEESKEDEMDEDTADEFTGFSDDDDSLDEPAPEQGEQLLDNLFSHHVELPQQEYNLPHWKPLKLSAFSMSGLHALGFDTPTPIQKKSIPLAIEGRDVIGKATTGSGKTLAYGIPVLERYVSNLETYNLNRQKKIITPPSGIIFVPTRELAKQVVDHLDRLSKYFPIPTTGIVSITGGLSIQKQERQLKMSPGIIVATPGRCLELLEKDEDLIKQFSSTDMIVLDEADRLLQDGHFDEFEKILTMFKKHRPHLPEWRWQTLVFSATFATELFSKLSKHVKSKGSDSFVDNEEVVKLLKEKLQFKDKKPVLIDASPKEIVSGDITEALVECGPTERDLYLYYFLLMYKGSTLVFTNSIDSVKRLVPFLNNLNIPAFAIHSGMIQKQRLRSLERFKASTKSNSISVLVASDVAARGLDVPDIDHVAHYHLPRSADVYIHRSGRTARAGKQGVSVMFCSPQEASGPLKKLRKLVAANGTHTKFNPSSDVKLLPIEDDLVSQLTPRAQIASKLANSVFSDSSSKKEDNWVKQAAEDLGIDDLSDIDDFEDDMIKRDRKRKEGKTLTKDDSKSLRWELKQMLNEPIRKLNRRSYLTSGVENLAHIMVSGKTHKDIVGHQNVKALQDLKGKNYKVTKPKDRQKGKQKYLKDKQDKKDKKKDIREQNRRFPRKDDFE